MLDALLDGVTVAIYILTSIVLLGLALQVAAPLGVLEFVLVLVLAVPVTLLLSRAWRAKFGP